jgi:hypothetical protein
VVFALALVTVAPALAQQFPEAVLTNQDKINWLHAEMEKIRADAQQGRVAGQTLTRVANLSALVDTLPGGDRSLQTQLAALYDTVLVGIAKKLKIGSIPQQVIVAIGPAHRVVEVTTAAGTEEEWSYGRAAGNRVTLVFENGKLTKIRREMGR